MNTYLKIGKLDNSVTGTVMTLKRWLVTAGLFSVGGALLLAARKAA